MWTWLSHKWVFFFFAMFSTHTLCCVLLPPLHLPPSSHFSHTQGVTSWFVFYLIKEKGVADAAQAAVRVSGLELGGLVGSLIAGRLSDMMINNSKKGEGAVGKRVQVCVVTSLLLLLLCEDAHWAGGST